MGTELVPKRLEFLFELVPRTSVIGLLLNPNIEIPQSVVKDAEEAANRRRVKLHVLHATTEKEIDVAFATLDQLHAGALLVGDDPSFTNQREQLVALASRYAVPAIYQWRDFAIAGGLISYGVSLTTLYSLAGARAARILKEHCQPIYPSSSRRCSSWSSTSRQRRLSISPSQPHYLAALMRSSNDGFPHPTEPFALEGFCG